MSVRVADPTSAPAIPEPELLGRLGLRPGASDDQVEAAHDEILEYLAAAPGSLRDWVRSRTLEVDEAYALLNGAALAPSSPRPIPAPAAAPAAAPAPAARTGTNGNHGGNGSQAKAEVRVRAGDHAQAGVDALGGDLFGEDWIDERDGATVITRRDRRQAKLAQQRGKAVATAPGSVTISKRLLRNAGILGGLAAAAIVVVIGVFNLGQGAVPGINGTPAPSASAVSLDAAAVAADMAKIQANPKDVAALQDLANQYYAVSDYETAKTWLDKVLAIDPKSIPALLGSGAVAYNLGDNAAAEQQWRAVLAIDPKNLEAHFDLGFMFFSATPPNIDGVKTEWNAYLAAAPSDDPNREYLEAHLASLDKLASGAPASGAPAGSPAPAVSPAASTPASPAASPAASPVPAAS